MPNIRAAKKLFKEVDDLRSRIGSSRYGGSLRSGGTSTVSVSSPKTFRRTPRTSVTKVGVSPRMSPSSSGFSTYSPSRTGYSEFRGSGRSGLYPSRSPLKVPTVKSDGFTLPPPMKVGSYKARAKRIGGAVLSRTAKNALKKKTKKQVVKSALRVAAKTVSKANPYIGAAAVAYDLGAMGYSAYKYLRDRKQLKNGEAHDPSDERGAPGFSRVSNRDADVWIHPALM